MRASILWRRLLRTGLAAGGIFDLALAAVLAVRSLYPWFTLAEALYTALLQGALGLACLAAANDPRRYGAIVWIAGVARLALAPLFLVWAVEPAQLDVTTAAVGAVEIALAAAHLIPAWWLRR